MRGSVLPGPLEATFEEEGNPLLVFLLLAHLRIFSPRFMRFHYCTKLRWESRATCAMNGEDWVALCAHLGRLDLHSILDASKSQCSHKQLSKNTGWVPACQGFRCNEHFPWPVLCFKEIFVVASFATSTIDMQLFKRQSLFEHGVFKRNVVGCVVTLREKEQSLSRMRDTFLGRFEELRLLVRIQEWLWREKATYSSSFVGCIASWSGFFLILVASFYYLNIKKNCEKNCSSATYSLHCSSLVPLLLHN
jgi:hypothetical protein